MHGLVGRAAVADAHAGIQVHTVRRDLVVGMDQTAFRAFEMLLGERVRDVPETEGFISV
jgi:hypothetical protein